MRFVLSEVLKVPGKVYENNSALFKLWVFKGLMCHLKHAFLIFQSGVRLCEILIVVTFYILILLDKVVFVAFLLIASRKH